VASLIAVASAVILVLILVLVARIVQAHAEAAAREMQELCRLTCGHVMITWSDGLRRCRICGAQEDTHDLDA
jgi:predicted transcriptional regulator